ncbi:superfamily II DNA helicase RecQ [Metabacillus crassostreae]|uniref:RQC-minor-1 family DNA-binding protein n=1 Tax=Metabacillus crassostreae TaxID=929098 RepID=UPI00195E8805|nr:RQC-minor-1 family DNA-binding protein [Metabacillus crassostreae]MBM7604856.1 superfamily II DNA helicase RecQ [Metabacillus crassostreae]
MKTEEKTSLSTEEIKAILRAADEIIAEGGRTLLAKILKGSREKKVLQLKLDRNPSYGFFKSETLDNVMEKIDWMIDYDFLDIHYRGKLPMIIFTDRGWEIEADQRTDELLTEWREWLKQDITSPDMNYLKDRNRPMILLFLEKVKETRDKDFIPYLKLWKDIEYKKLKEAINHTINSLEMDERLNEQNMKDRKKSIDEALKGAPPEDLLLKCWECGDRFTFSIGEQKFYKQRRFELPKRCTSCREQRYEEYIM